MNQNQLAELFDTSVPNISMHISNILKEMELEYNSVIKDYLTTAADGKKYKVNFFAGRGMGRLKVPKGEDEPNSMGKGICYNIEGGINVVVFWKIGFYGIYKYLYANKEINSVKVIDFNEHIVLLGITVNFSL